MTNYNFEWDPHKARSNQVKHGISFEEAATVFRDPQALSIFDDEHSSNEDRWITIGISNVGRLVVICHTFQKKDESNVAWEYGKIVRDPSLSLDIYLTVKYY